MSIAGSSLVAVLISLSFMEVEKGKPSDGLQLARELGFVEPDDVSLPPISLPTPLLALLTVAGFAAALVALALALAGVTGLAALGLRALDRMRPDGAAATALACSQRWPPRNAGSRRAPAPTRAGWTSSACSGPTYGRCASASRRGSRSRRRVASATAS